MKRYPCLFWFVCVFVCLFVCFSLFACFGLSVCFDLFVYLFWFVCLFVCLFVCFGWFVCLSVCLFCFVYLFWFVCFVCLFICLFVCFGLFVCLSVCLVCLCVCDFLVRLFGFSRLRMYLFCLPLWIYKHTCCQFLSFKKLFPKPFSYIFSQYFTELEKRLVAVHPPNKQQSVVDCFKSLMENVERSLVGKNRDRYSRFSDCHSRVSD